ncbi:DUF1007 family protein [Sulfurospirillum oryzae]|uniref:DUF1007 family protein n=1 Tax=Sulfurospirillum oryzae TaxID=2976535 RepID=UPI0021E928FF|nr:DUF1007 family protein [Sulfurospirillum oryzae]
MFKIVLITLLSFNTAFSCALCSNKVSFVQTSIKAYASDDSLQKIHIKWQFGSSTSAEIARVYQIEKQMQEDDLQKIYASLEKNQNPPFMTFLNINGENIAFKIENFTIFLENNLMNVEFDIPLSYTLRERNNVEIVFFDSTKTIIFLNNLDNTQIITPTHYKTRKDNGIKVIKEMMATTNYIKLEITK